MKSKKGRERYQTSLAEELRLALDKAQITPEMCLEMIGYLKLFIHPLKYSHNSLYCSIWAQFDDDLINLEEKWEREVSDAQNGK